MSRITQKVITLLAVSFIIGFFIVFIILFLYNLKNFPAEYQTVKALQNALLLRESLIQVLKNLPVVIIFIYVTSFSILFTLPPFQTGSLRYRDISSPSYVLLIFFLMIIIASEFIGVPFLYRDTERIKDTIEISKKSLSYAQDLFNRGDFEKARSILNLYMEIDENNAKANKLYSVIIDRLSQKTFGTQERVQETYEIRIPENYFERGKEEYEKENYYSALFYLERALTLHRDSKEINELYEKAKKKVVSLLGSITKKDAETKRLIQTKERAITLLGERDYYEAYKIFSVLSRSYPELEDLKLYLNAVEKELLKIDFLIEELKESEWLPSRDNIIFFDRRGYINTIERVIYWKGNYYFYNIRRYRTLLDKTEVQFVRYGKWIEKGIRLKDREGFTRISEKEEEQNYIYPFTHPGYLSYFNDIESLLKQLTIYEYFTISEAIYKSGIDIEDKLIFLSHKLGIFFSAYTLTILLSALGWAKRSIYDFPPIMKFLLFILIMPFMAFLFNLLYRDMNSIIIYAHRYVSRFLSQNINVLIFTAIINATFGAVATFYFLSQSSKVE